VPRESLLDQLQRHGEAGLRSAQALSREFQSAYRDIHDLILARSSAGKLAKLLLSWTPPSGNNTKEIRVRSGLIHEEMAQMIGASRETVTRLLSDLRKTTDSARRLNPGHSQWHGPGSVGVLNSFVRSVPDGHVRLPASPPSKRKGGPKQGRLSVLPFDWCLFRSGSRVPR
jgi:Crp-like helix-turn-helix domain